MRIALPFPWLVAVCFLVSAGMMSRAVGAESIVLEIAAGPHDREGTVVTAELPAALADAESLRLTRLDTPRAVPVQCFEEEKKYLAWMLDEPLPAGATRRYRLEAADASDLSEKSVHVVDDSGHLIVSVGEKPVLQYHCAVAPSPDAAQPCYGRSGFIHPVYSPAGSVVTDDFPPDHMHQHGIMFAWVNTTFEGRSVDFWNEKSEQGKVRHVSVERCLNGPILGGFDVRLRHIDRTAPEGPKPVLDELWRVRVFNTAGCFLFDITSTQTCAGESPLVLNEYHYGGMAFRGRRDWLGAENADFLTSEGKSRIEGNHSRPRWCDIQGPGSEEPVGVTVFCHPSNPRFPQPVRLHPEKPYFCFAPVVLGPMRIEPGRPLVSCYRYCIHDGPIDVLRTERLWRDFAEPVAVRLVERP